MSRAVEELKDQGVNTLAIPSAGTIAEFVNRTLYRHRMADEATELFLAPQQKRLWRALSGRSVSASLETVSLGSVTRQHLLDLESAELSLQKIARDHEANVARIRMQRNQLRRQVLVYGRKLRKQTTHIKEERARTAKQLARTEEQKARAEEERGSREREQRRVGQLEQEVKKRERTTEEQRARAEEERGSREREQRRVGQLEQEVKKRERTIEGLHNSFSWRVTLPLRVLRRQRDRVMKAVKRRRRERMKGKRPVECAIGGRPGETRRANGGARDGESTYDMMVRMTNVAREARAARDLKRVAMAEERLGTGHARIKVSVISWCCSHNPLGRAYLLADLLSSEVDVEIVGACFPNFGEDVWEPLRASGRVTIKTFPGGRFPNHFDRMEEVARQIDGDILYVSKARLPSMELGILAKEVRSRPLILDVDDYELGFFEERSPMTLEEVRTLRCRSKLEWPYQETWTRYSETLIPLFDRLTVATPELRDKFGGTLIPHARNESDFDPFVYPRERTRQILGFGCEDKVVVFLGTPRAHKGVVRIAETVRDLTSDGYRFLIVGTPSDSNLRRYLEELDPKHAKVLPNVPFADVPAYLRAADLVCLLQSQEHATAHFQMPAKFTDALAMGLPILGTNVPPLARVGAEGLLEVVQNGTLGLHIERMFADRDAMQRKGHENRKNFRNFYCYRAVRPTLMEVLESARGKPTPMREEFGKLLAYHREHPKKTDSGREATLRIGTYAAVRNQSPPGGRRTHGGNGSAYVDDKIDIVFFWKQNDSGIYGRRQDMLTKYLSRASAVNMVLHLDAPMAANELFGLAVSWQRNTRFSQNRLVAWQTVKRVLNWQANDCVIARTYLYVTSRQVPRWLQQWLPSEKGYLDYLSRTMNQVGIGKRRLVFWVCPRNFHFPEIVGRFSPDLVLADVIDDHRRWPDVQKSYKERLSRNYEDILALSDVVLANCEAVQKAMLAYTETVHLIPNAIENVGGVGGRGRKPRKMRRIEAPIVGYVGNLDGARLDVKLLEKVAVARPGWNLVLIGSMHRSSEVQILERYPNVHFLGVVNYEEAQRCMRYFNVAIVPHVDSELTRHMSPLKVYVYLAMGLPVVSTAVAHLDAFGEFVCRAKDGEEFIDSVEQCLNSNVYRGREGRLQKFLERNTWDGRVQKILALMDDMFDELGMGKR